MKATPLTRIGSGFWFTLCAESLTLKRRKASQRAVATLAVALQTGCPITVESTIHGDGQRYDYVRPLLTIGPTAIRFGVPINTQLPFNDSGLLADTLLDPQYHNDTIYVAWEHSSLVAFAEVVLKRFHDLAPVPQWPDSDYDTFYVFRMDWGKVPTLKFEVRSENLGPISENCPQASKP